MMKNIVYVLVFILFITGCSTKKEVVVEKTKPEVNKALELQKLKEQKELKEKQDKLNQEILKDQEEISFVDGSTEPIMQDQLVFDKEKTMDIAVVFPSKIIGKYSKSSINTISGYFIYKKMNFDIQVFDSQIESSEKIIETIEKLKASGIKKVIALYTVNAMPILNTIEGLEDFEIYFPLINKEEVSDVKSNFIFGGISYEDQMLELLNLSNYDNIMYYQNSHLGRKLKAYYENLTLDGNLSQEIQRKNNNYKTLVKKIELDEKTIFLNTSIVKTSILLSQFTIYNKEPYKVLSTQLNYNPLLISLTQKDDRLNFYVANSIDEVDEVLSDIISNLGANVKYNWVDYSTLVGINYLYDFNISNLIKTKIENKQVVYEPKIYNSTSYGFIKVNEEDYIKNEEEPNESLEVKEATTTETKPLPTF